MDEQERILKRLDEIESRISGVDGRLIRVEEKLISIDARLMEQAHNILNIVQRLDLLSATNMRLDQADHKIGKIEKWIEGFWAKVVGVGVGISVIVKAIGDWVSRH